jgi:hypothetical protein
VTREEAVEAFVAACREQLAAEAAITRKAEAARALRDAGVPIERMPQMLSAALARAGFSDDEIEALGVTRANFSYMIHKDKDRRRR